MSDLSSFSSMATILQTSNIVWQSVSLTDDVKINLEYDIHQGLLNIFVKNIGNNNKLPCHINVLSNRSEANELISNSIFNLPEIQQDSFELISDNEPKICYEISTTYVYDLNDEPDNPEQIDFSPIMITSSSSSSSSSSCFDEQTLDNDDGYSTHSHDDIEQQQLSLVVPSPKFLLPSFSSSHRYYYSEQYVSSIRRLIEQLTWLSPFKKTIQQMMMNHRFV